MYEYAVSKGEGTLLDHGFCAWEGVLDLMDNHGDKGTTFIFEQVSDF